MQLPSSACPMNFRHWPRQAHKHSTTQNAINWKTSLKPPIGQFPFAAAVHDALLFHFPCVCTKLQLHLASYLASNIRCHVQ
jgi:hypothetical protein